MTESGRNALLWAELEPHLDRILQLDPQEREACLVGLAATQPLLARALRELLAERDELEAVGFLESFAAADAQELTPMMRDVLARSEGAEPRTTAMNADFVPDIVVGPYRLIREIARGGMSSVWLAERCDRQLKREIALKLPLVGPRMHVERFLRERDILAALTHPNIARLYDAGISDSGQPYLAMEYVEGTALTRSCDAQRLTIHERLRLFVQVLEAVQFAHAKLIIHRDLKPSNILVTPEGRVALLDFGIGKLLSNDESQATHLTQLAGHPLTPDYASPEQIAGQPLGTASDLYSLGVILYELLTGTRPYRPKNATRAALQDAILNDDVPRPSQSEISLEAAHARRASSRTLVRLLRGDLDTIVLKSLKRDSGERYASISVFSQDINDYLHSRPVSARPDSLWYRVRRFSSRYKVQVTAAAIAVIALLGGAGATVWQARAAATERDRAVVFASRNEAVTDFLGQVIAEAAASPAPITVTELLERSEKLALSDTGDSPENRAAVLGMITDQYLARGSPGRARHLIERALQMLHESPDNALRSRLICKHAMIIAGLENLEAPKRTLSLEIERLQADPETASRCSLGLTKILVFEHRGDDAVRAAERGLAFVREAGGRPAEVEAALLSSAAYGYNLSNRHLQAEQYFERSLQTYLKLGREHSNGAISMLNDWGLAALNAGVPRRALPLFERIERTVRQRGPDIEPSAVFIGNRGLALFALGRFEQARAAFDRACQLARLHKSDFLQLHCLRGLARTAIETSSLDEAAEHLNGARQLLPPSAPSSHPAVRMHATLQGRLDLAHGRLNDARANFDRALETRGGADTVALATKLGMAMLELAEGNAAEAAQEARAALRIATEMQGDLPHSNHTAQALLTLGRALKQLGDEDEARKMIAAALTHLSNTVDADHPALVEARAMQ